MHIPALAGLVHGWRVGRWGRSRRVGESGTSTDVTSPTPLSLPGVSVWPQQREEREQRQTDRRTDRLTNTEGAREEAREIYTHNHTHARASERRERGGAARPSHTTALLTQTQPQSRLSRSIQWGSDEPRTVTQTRTRDCTARAHTCVRVAVYWCRRSFVRC